jgi:ketosteroid isomerase-like protein
MVSANVELVRSIRAALERGDYSSAEWAHPEIEYVWADGPDPGSWRGRSGMAGRMRDFLSAWTDFRTVTEEYVELDDERVLVLIGYRGQGKRSGLEAEQLHAKGASLYHVREGRVTRMVQYLDRERALADLGLAPQGPE